MNNTFIWQDYLKITQPLRPEMGNYLFVHVTIVQAYAHFMILFGNTVLQNLYCQWETGISKLDA